MLKFGNKEFRNLQEQVKKNMDDILFILQEEGVLNEFGIKVVGQEELVTDMPTVADYKENNPDWSYGDAYAIGEEEPYELYILTRANGTHPNDYWFNIGEFPAPGPEGPEGPEGPQGPQGQTGATGANGLPAGFGTVSATATTLTEGSPATVSVTTSGPDTAMNIAFDFGIPKGDSGSGQSTEWGSITGTLSDQTDLVTALQGKQNTLVSGTNIKTINSESILGSGDLTITAGVSDVQVNGTSVVTAGVAEVTVPTNYVTTDTNQTISGNKTLSGSTSFGGSGAISISGTGVNVYSPASINTYGADINLSGASLKMSNSSTIKSGTGSYGLAIPTTTSWIANKTIATTDQIPSVNYPVTDVQVDGSSVLDGTVAKITMPDLSGYAETADLGDCAYLDENELSIAYSQVTNTPTIPTDTSDLTNTAGFITSSDIPVTDVTLGGTSVLSSGVAVLPAYPDAVSGTNDGTNWTSITIGSTTKAIPSGGSGPTPSNMVTTDTDQTITGVKTFEGDIKLRYTSSELTTYSGKSLVGYGLDYIKLGSTSGGGTPSHDFDELRLDAVAVVPAGGSTLTMNSDLGSSSKKWKSLYVHQLKDGNAANYTTGLQLPDMTSWTASKTIATTDDIPVVPANIVEDVEVNGTSVVTAGVAEIDLSGYATTSDISDMATETWVGNQGYLTSVSWSDVSSKPTFATVATSGDYDDLINKPTIPTIPVTDVQVDGTSVLSGTVAEIDLSSYVESSDLATVATTGDYDDLLNKPTIPDTTYMVTTNTNQTISGTKTFSSNILPNANYTRNIGDGTHIWSTVYATALATGESLYKAALPNMTSWTANKTLATTDQIPSLTGYATETWVGNQGYAVAANLATVATSGDYDDLLNKPTIPTVPVTDVQINSTSILSSGTANIVTNTAYNSSTNPIATMSDIPSVPVTDVTVGGTSVVSSGTAVIPAILGTSTETWTFTLSDGTTVTKTIVLG